MRKPDKVSWYHFKHVLRVAAEMRLSRVDLREARSFADEWRAVRRVLAEALKPVCILAHNGIRFDYRVLFFELHRCGMLLQNNAFPDEVSDLSTTLTKPFFMAFRCISWIH